MAGPDASALHVVGCDASGHELVLHVSVPETCGRAILIWMKFTGPCVESSVLCHRGRAIHASGDGDNLGEFKVLRVHAFRDEHVNSVVVPGGTTFFHASGPEGARLCHGQSVSFACGCHEHP